MYHVFMLTTSKKVNKKEMKKLLTSNLYHIIDIKWVHQIFNHFFHRLKYLFGHHPSSVYIVLTIYKILIFIPLSRKKLCFSQLQIFFLFVKHFWAFTINIFKQSTSTTFLYAFVYPFLHSPHYQTFLYFLSTSNSFDLSRSLSIISLDTLVRAFGKIGRKCEVNHDAIYVVLREAVAHHRYEFVRNKNKRIEFLIGIGLVGG